jgi:broad specificity phosphatase PhoE
VPDTCVLNLVRHGEVFNPNHIVYGDLPGFHLSGVGVQQVHRTGSHLADANVDLVLTSPLARAVETAHAIARPHGLAPKIDARLTESGQFPHWTGNRWESISTLFPGELEGYLENADSAGGSELLSEVARRYTSVVDDATVGGHAAIVIVGHQDPVQAARLLLTCRDLSELRLDPPGHGERIELHRSAEGHWVEVSRWAPEIVTG